TSAGSSKIDISMREFKEYVEVIEVMDVHHSGLNFTWNQKPKGSDGILKKIDRIVSNVDFTDCFEGSHAIFKPYLAQKAKMLKRPLRKLLFDGGNLHDNVNRLRAELDQVQADLDADPYNISLHKVEATSVVAFSEATILLEHFLKQKANIDWLKEDVFVSHYVNFLGEAGHTSGFDGPIIRLLSLRRRRILWKRMSLMRFLNFLSMGKRGLQQGDPLSPYLFTLVMEILTLMLKRKVRLSNSFSFHRYCSKLELINLCFTDDLFLFSHGDTLSTMVIKEALEEFTCASGLVPSLSKSMAYFCNVVSHTKAAILQILPFEEGRLPVKYLGVPLVSSKLIYRDCKELIEKVQASGARLEK
nr:putative reverse transcriptase domain, reverse transcriptase zinc-binding domain protein [Tanacetum cinerariifolium]